MVTHVTWTHTLAISHVVHRVSGTETATQFGSLEFYSSCAHDADLSLTKKRNFGVGHQLGMVICTRYYTENQNSTDVVATDQNLYIWGCSGCDVPSRNKINAYAGEMPRECSALCSVHTNARVPSSAMYEHN